MAELNDAVIVCSAATAIAYLSAITQLARKRWNGFAGSRRLNVLAVCGFVLARFFPQNIVAVMAASLAVAAALIAVTRRSTVLTALLTAAPLLAMLLTVYREFFSGTTANDFQTATIAVLCAPGPIALIAWISGLSRQTRDSPTTFDRSS